MRQSTRNKSFWRQNAFIMSRKSRSLRKFNLMSGNARIMSSASVQWLQGGVGGAVGGWVEQWVLGWLGDLGGADAVEMA